MHIYDKQKKIRHDNFVVFSVVHNWFLGPDHVTREIVDAEQKFQNSHYDWEKSVWHLDKNMEGLKSHCFSGIDDGTKLCKML